MARKPPTHLPLAQTLFLFTGIIVGILCCRKCGSPGASAPATLPSSSAVALELPVSIDPPAPEGSSGVEKPVPSRRTGEELVRAAIGRWEAQDGALEIAVDPPLPSGPSKRPPYHLVVSKAGAVPYGCEFSDPSRVRIPGLHAVDGYELTFRAWCGAPSKQKQDTYVALALENGALRVAVTQGQTTKLTSGPMTRRATR